MSVLRLHTLRRALILPLALVCAAVLLLAAAAPAQAQTTRTPPVNIANAVFIVQCPFLIESTVEVKFAYVQLDGNAAVRSATVGNGGLTQVEELPVVLFSRLSFDFTQDALYRFVLEDGSVQDVVVAPEYWYVERRTSNLYSGVSC